MFRVFLIVLFVLQAVVRSAEAQTNPDLEKAEESRAMIEERMQILSFGLASMPVLPKLDQEIEIPDFQLESSPSKTIKGTRREQ